MVIKIPLTQDKVAVVDEVDADLVNFKWSVVRQGRKSNPIWYAVRDSRMGRGKPNIRMHRVILERMIGRSLKKNEETDHKNHDGRDNRRSNIRLATKSENLRNQRVQGKSKSSQFKGVWWHKRDEKWSAAIQGGTRTWLGYFDTEEDAARAYDAEAKVRYGLFAVLNFPEDI